MPELKDWIGNIKHTPVPPLWADIERRDVGGSMDEGHHRRPALAAAILTVTLVVVGSALYGLGLLSDDDASIAPGPGPGEIVRYRLDGPPQPITVGEGAAWVSVGAGDGSPNYLGRIDAATGEVSKVDAPGGDWTAVGGESAWLLCDAAACEGGSVLRLDPSTGEQIGSTRLPGRGSQITGTDDGVWVSTDAGVVFIDGSGEIVKSIGVRNANLIGSDGEHLWVSGPGSVLQLDPRSGDGLARVEFSDPCTMEVADGTVWVASCGGGPFPGSDADRLMGIDASTGEVLFDRAIEGHGQMRYADGVLYLAQNDPKEQKQIRILRFNPKTGEDLGAPIILPRGEPAGFTMIGSFGGPHVFFAVGEGSLWVTDFGAGEVIRVGIPSEPTGAVTEGDAVTVPDLVGLPIKDAIKTAEDAGLTVDTIQVLDDSKLGEPGADEVQSQDPFPGTEVDEGASISVAVIAMAHSMPSPVEHRSSPEGSASKLIGPAWQLTSIQDVVLPEGASPVWVAFGATDISGSDGCDDLSAHYRVSVSPGSSPWANLDVGPIDPTTACSDASDEERASTFRSLMADAQDLKIEGDTLTIRSPIGTLMFVDPLALDCQLIRGGTSIGDTGGVDPEGAVRLLVSGIGIDDRIVEVGYASQGVAYLVVRDDLTIAWAKVGSGPDGATRVEFDACDGTGLSAAHSPD